MPSLLCLSFFGSTSQDKHPVLDCGDHAAYLDPQRSGLPGLWGQQVDAREQTDSIAHLKHLPQLQGWGWKRWSRAAGLPFISKAGCGRGRCDTGSRVPRPPRMHLGSNAGRGGCVGAWWGVDQDPSLLCCESFHHCLYQGHTSHDYCQPMMDCKPHTRGGLFLGDLGPLTSSFGSTLKRCIAG